MTTTMGSLDLSALNNLYDETQYFWFESNAQPWGAGAHVTLYPQSEFTTSTHANYLKGQNILMNTDGLSIRNGTLPMMTLDNDSLDFNVVDTVNGTYTNVASFGTDARVGKSTATHTIIDSNGMRVYASNGTTLIADLGYGESVVDGVLTNTPSYTFGARKTSGFSAYSSTQTYSYGDIVTYNSKGYVCVGNQIRSVPPTNTNYWVTLNGENTMSIGDKNVVSGSYSIGVGYNNTVTGDASIAVGSNSDAKLTTSIAVGTYAKANSYTTSAFGAYVTAGYPAQTVVGQYNDNKSTSLFEIGNGSADDSRSNAFQVDTSGNTVMAGDITVKNHASPIGTRKVTTGSYSVATGNDYVTVPTTSLTRLSLEAGSWAINLSAQYASNATGRRGCAIYDVTASSRVSRSEVNQTAVSGAQTKLQTSIVVVLDATTTITAQLSQNSGAARTCDIVLEAMRIA